ncbi:alpha/beta fold hydrolase [Nocardia otitidiscaviarum]|uniref:alpha/beta hydrolase n=1 Tax=Nocardia otitidiscaviarum TaxID=1823 RepID=UPI0004A6FAFE|nr:alpha/beta hydrolase [Nocardia otitidiscaviarum]MBF6135120.1 alpha/beta fold hydrolase [Nocardia otitidiscaviarum]MBF6486942.1 alpha/beta fold hydrolase [Nocardia otitidiscaviarum]
MRWTRAALLASTLSILVTTGCGAGPSDRPDVAVERPRQAGEVQTSTEPTPPPAPEVPKTELAWRDCTVPTFNLLSLGTPPAGLVLECAEYTTQVDATGGVGGNFQTAALRARYDRTPADAAPLVLTSGSDRASTATLAAFAAGGAGALLSERPVVAVDRRGIGSSEPIDCVGGDIRQRLLDQAQFGPGASDPVAAVAGLSQDATISCQDYLQPGQGTFDAAHAADDIEQLRRQWQVEHIALLGSGSGSNIALAYARKYGDHLARLVLDSPEPVDTDAVGRAEQRVKGAEAALTAFAQRCRALNCALGDDPRTAIADLVARAERGEFGELSASALVTTLSDFLGDPRGLPNPVVTEFADALAALGRGDRGPITPRVQRAAAAIANDGAFVNRCSDSQVPATPVQARELMGTWGGEYPVFGRVAAIDLMVCSAWPVAAPQAMPEKFELDTLVLGAKADPVVGDEGRPTVTGALAAAGARTSTVEWQGWGHPVVSHSGCAQRAVVDYLRQGTLPENGTACPA